MIWTARGGPAAAAMITATAQLDVIQTITLLRGVELLTSMRIAARAGSARTLGLALFIVAVLMHPGRLAAQSADSAVLASPEGLQMAAGLASTGLSPDSVFRELRRGSYGAARGLSARAVATALSPREQTEVAQIRLKLARALPLEMCARTMWDGDTRAGVAADATMLTHMSQDDKQRVAFLTWRAIGLSLQGITNDTKPLSVDEFGELFGSVAKEEERAALSAAVSDQADARAKCNGALALYTFVLSLPAEAPSRAAALRYLLGASAM